MLAMPLGIITLVIDLESQNALPAIPLTPIKSKSPESVFSHPIAQPSTNSTPGIVLRSYNLSLQPSNAECSIFVTLLGIVTLVRDEQPKNAPPPILVTLLGILTLIRDEQLRNASSPMRVTLFGIVTLVRDEQPENASSSMLVTGYLPRVDGIVIAPDVDRGMAEVEYSPPRLALPFSRV